MNKFDHLIIRESGWIVERRETGIEKKAGRGRKRTYSKCCPFANCHEEYINWLQLTFHSQIELFTISVRKSDSGGWFFSYFFLFLFCWKRTNNFKIYNFAKAVWKRNNLACIDWQGTKECVCHWKGEENSSKKESKIKPVSITRLSPHVPATLVKHFEILFICG